MNYALYIKSKNWRDVRALRLGLDKHTCQQCGQKVELRVHHKTYENIGKELQGDLITLCARCHNDTHWSLVHKADVSEKDILRMMPITEEQFRKKESEGKI